MSLRSKTLMLGRWFVTDGREALRHFLILDLGAPPNCILAAFFRGFHIYFGFSLRMSGLVEGPALLLLLVNVSLVLGTVYKLFELVINYPKRSFFLACYCCVYRLPGRLVRRVIADPGFVT
jgi:hypothetical protein